MEGGGYGCKCLYGFYGDRCELSSLGFEESSYMELPPLDPISNDITMTLATKSMNALLLFQSGTGEEFMALQVVNGSITFTFHMVDLGRRGITVSKVLQLSLIQLFCY